MKEIKAYVHRDRVADVIAGLKESNIWGGPKGDARHNLAVYLIRAMVGTASAEDRHYSTELGDEVINEYKLELICQDEEADEIVQLIVATARTGTALGGWITVSDLVRVERIH